MFDAYLCIYREMVVYNKNAKFGLKLGQIDPKWDKSDIFLDQISVHFGSPSQNVLKFDLKSLIFVPFRAHLINFSANLWILPFDETIYKKKSRSLRFSLNSLPRLSACSIASFLAYWHGAGTPTVPWTRRKIQFYNYAEMTNKNVLKSDP